MSNPGEQETPSRTAAIGAPARAADPPDRAELFSTVTQLAAELGITARTIRFYEDKGLISPRRAGSTRVYTARDRARMILILRGKRLGFSLREIREYLDLYDRDRTQVEQLMLLLAAVRKRLGLLQQQREALDQTVAELEEIERQVEAALAAKAPGAPESRRGEGRGNGHADA